MEHWMVKVGEPPMARLLLKVDEEEAIFYRQFVERHGGSFVGLRSPKSSYRLDFPPGTRVERNEGYEPHDSYRIVYPDGVALTWYRMFKLDGRWIDDVLLVPVPDDDDWALFDSVPAYTRE
jgi:hypothetical protein